MIKQVDVNNKSYNIVIKKSKQAKHIQLRIHKTGEINLIVPLRSSIEKALNFLDEQLEWIEKKISKLAFNKNKFRYLGSRINIRSITDKKDNLFSIYWFDNELIKSTSQEIKVEQLYDQWLFEKAKLFIPQRVHQVADKYGFVFNSVKVKRLRSRWGSCSSKKNLSFSYRLMQFDINVIDYVIIHELCHLKEMNHSKAFWSLVRSVLPDYQNYKKTLSSN